jgi:O-antigen/teichoic acid export membrane protein
MKTSKKFVGEFERNTYICLQILSDLNHLKQLAGQTAIYGLGTIVPRLMNYLLMTPFYTRVFQKGEYGVVTELYAYAALLMVLLTYGMETTFF